MKNILITGSTDGIGKLTAEMIVKKNHTVYIHGRSQEKVDITISELKKNTGNNNISGFVADFSDLGSVRSLSKEITKKIGYLDVLINNAGVFKSQEQKNTSGFDMRIAVNYLAPYVLTNNLLPLLNKSENPRVINLSSAAQSGVSLDVLSGKKTESEHNTYVQSKLALTMWSFHMAKQHPDISFIAVNPGSLLNTNMVKEAYGMHWSSVDKGAEILISLALSEEYKGVSGKYFDNDKGSFGEAHSDAYDSDIIMSLINFTNTLI